MVLNLSNAPKKKSLGAHASTVLALHGAHSTSSRASHTYQRVPILLCKGI